MAKEISASLFGWLRHPSRRRVITSGMGRPRWSRLSRRANFGGRRLGGELFAAFLAGSVALIGAGCGSPSATPGTAATTGSNGGSSVATAAPLTDQQRVEGQAFDLWVGQWIAPLAVTQMGIGSSGSSVCHKEGEIQGGMFGALAEWCSQWALRITNSGKVKGEPLSGAIMATAIPAADQRFMVASWSCSGTDYLIPPAGGLGANKPVSKVGTYGSTGTVERRQIGILVTPQAVSDADHANGITWRGHVQVTFIQRSSFLVEDFGNIGNILHSASVVQGNQPQPPAVGQWSSYSDIQSDADVALQNGKLTSTSGSGEPVLLDTTRGTWSGQPENGDCTFG
jgi:hypothetical protein